MFFIKVKNLESTHTHIHTQTLACGMSSKLNKLSLSFVLIAIIVPVSEFIFWWYTPKSENLSFETSVKIGGHRTRQW